MASSTIFTPEVIGKINEFVMSVLYDDRVSNFDLSKYSQFEQVKNEAASGKTEFEIEIDLEQMESPEVFESVLGYFFEGYIFSKEYRYATRLIMKLHEESNTLEVIASLVLGGWSGGSSSNIEEYIVYDGEIIPFEDYVDMSQDEDYDEDYEEDYDEDIEERYALAREEFIEADRIDPSDVTVFTEISLEN